MRTSLVPVVAPAVQHAHQRGRPGRDRHRRGKRKHRVVHGAVREPVTRAVTAACAGEPVVTRTRSDASAVAASDQARPRSSGRARTPSEAAP
ncbi:hypothetical protein [Streptomyces sp. NPDC059909]|uniref:hypothetical protein n=1 Tax=Streptomyces sp. NPDC059909 TaxID=3346998 RepID=UPI0036527B7A